MAAALNALSGAFSAGTVTVSFKAGKVLVGAGKSAQMSKQIKDMAKEAELANKKLLKEQRIIGDQPYIAPKNTNGMFQTHGISVEQVPISIRNQLLSDLKAGGFSNPIDKLKEIIGSGKTVPMPIQTTNTKLYKLVPTKYKGPQPTTEY